MADDEVNEHPGEMSGGQRFMAMTKHVVGKALKWAAIGAVVGGVLFALAPGIVLGPLASIVGVFSSSAGATIASGMTSAAMTGALWLGGLAAGAGALMGLGGASEAADEAEQDQMANYERREARQERVSALSNNRDMQRAAMARQAQAMGIHPGHAIPHGLAHGGHGGPDFMG